MVPFETTIEGWACLMVAGDYSYLEVAQAYKLSNAEKSFLAAVDQAFIKRSNGLFTLDDYYRFDLAVLLLVEKWVAILANATQVLSKAEITAAKQSLPIQSIAEVAITGKDLLAWTGLRGGRWTGEWMGKITWAVLHGQCGNNPNNIKEWFLNEFKREE